MRITSSAILVFVMLVVAGCAGIEAISDRAKANIKASDLIKAGEYDKAEIIYKEGFAKRPDLYGEKLASLYIDGGRYEEALPYLQNITESVKFEYLVDPKKAPEQASRLNYLGEAYLAIGYYPEAESLFKRTLPGIEVLKQQKKYDAVNISAKILKLFLLSNKGFDTTKDSSDLSTGLNRSVLLNHNIDVQRIRGNLALVYVKTGRLQEASRIYELILEGKDTSPLTALRYGELLNRLGNAAAAENYFQLALVEGEKEFKSMRSNGKFRRSEEEIVSSEPNAGPLDRSSVDVLARVLVGIAIYHSSTGNTGLMNQYTDDLLGLMRQFEFNHPDHAEIYWLLGQIYQLKGSYEESVKYLERSLLLETRKGKSHLEIAHIYKLLSDNYSRQGKFSKSLEYLGKSLELEEKAIARNISVGSDRQKQSFISSLAESADLAVSFHLQTQPLSDEAFRLAFHTILSRKGRVLDSLSSDQQSDDTLDSNDLNYVKTTLSAIRTELTRRAFTNFNIVKSTSSFSIKDALLAVVFFASNVSLDSRITISRNVENKEPKAIDLGKTPTEDLERYAELLQDVLARQTTGAGNGKASLAIEEIALRLPENGVLVEYVLYKPYTVVNIGSGMLEPSSRYVAYTVNNENEKNWVDLGDARVIDDAIKEFYIALKYRQSSVKSLSRRLDRMIAQPVRKVVGSRRNILFSPDSMLNMIPFEALWTEYNEYMVESYTISYLSGGRELLRPSSKSESTAPPVIIANPDYQQKRGEPLNSENMPNEVATLAEWCCDYLPGTEDEARRLQAILPEADVFTGQKASKEMLAAVRSPSVLHIASHGFFLGEDFSLQSEALQNSEMKRLNPLLKSGIALAGFNPAAGYYNGVMTAFEATSLDLTRTSLVVLSACSTGVGDIQVGEGVLGLRRSFSIAGAASLVFSLWDVADKETADLMVDFYGATVSGVGKAEALRLAKMKMLQNSDTSHPFFWSAFILSGDRTAL